MTNKELRNAVVAKGLTRLGKNQYTQGANRDKVGDGWSDCSSFVRWCYKQIIGVDIGSNTPNQITNKKLIEVCAATNGQPDESKMLPGDLLFYQGTNKSRPFMVGHVELFIGDNTILGHGSGIGPKKQNMTNYNKSRYDSGKGLIKVLRVIPADASDKPALPTPPVKPNKVVTVSGGTSFVREKPGITGRILGVVKAGDKLPYRGETVNGWNAVVLGGKNGWHSGKYGKVG